jgi:dUTP pyrophosphatase
MANVKVRGFHKTDEDAIYPKRATKKSAGYDIHSNEDVNIMPGKTVLVRTGIAAYMLANEVLYLFPRSGNAYKFGITLQNCVGVIDSDFYPNEIGVLIRNEGEHTFPIQKGDRICQGVFMNFLVADDDQAERERTGGFGSSGI